MLELIKHARPAPVICRFVFPFVRVTACLLPALNHNDRGSTQSMDGLDALH
jgi:hypothetical protein